MNANNELPKRKRNRLKYFDYSSCGAYFITICTNNRECTLSNIVGAIHESPVIELTEYGKIVDRAINTMSTRFNIAIDTYVIMPNHIHLLMVIENKDEKRSIRESTLQKRSVISKAIGFMKMNASRIIHNQHGNAKVWQRSFHDHIIRNRQEYEKIYKYIYENPISWKYDCFYVEN